MLNWWNDIVDAEATRGKKHFFFCFRANLSSGIGLISELLGQ